MDEDTRSLGTEKRETFAHACEAYGRILELSQGPAKRLALHYDLGLKAPPTNKVDPAAYGEILSEAVSARNGWKRILERCAPARRIPWLA